MGAYVGASAAIVFLLGSILWTRADSELKRFGKLVEGMSEEEAFNVLRHRPEDCYKIQEEFGVTFFRYSFWSPWYCPARHQFFLSFPAGRLGNRKMRVIPFSETWEELLEFATIHPVPAFDPKVIAAHNFPIIEY